MPATDNTTLRGVLLYREPMAKHSSWRAGGVATRVYQPADLDDLQVFLTRQAPDEPLLWVGLGSNLLVRDGGFPGTVILTSGMLNELARGKDDSIYAQAGVSCAKVARFAARQGLVGAEFLAGIPGTLGGALAMNAGAFGGETWRLVESVETIDHAGRRRQRRAEDFEVGYRSVVGPVGEWFVSARLRLTVGDAAVAQARIKALLAQRGNTQPTQQPSCGSVFRNPPDDHAARLIEACGLKGACIGAACVSEKHANFIVNTGGASAADIERLIEHVAAQVLHRHGVRLEKEVHIVGLAAGGGE